MSVARILPAVRVKRLTVSHVFGRFMFPHRDGAPYARTWDILFSVTYEPAPKILSHSRGVSGTKWRQVDGVQHDMGWWTTTIWKDGVAYQDFYGWEADLDYHEYDKYYGRYRCKRVITDPESAIMHHYREHRVGFPWVKIWVTINPATDGNAQVRYRAYWWDGDEPLRFIVPKAGSRQLITKAEDASVTLLSTTEDLDENWIAYWRNDRKYIGIVAFRSQPNEIVASTELQILFPAISVTGGVENSLQPIFIGVLRLHDGSDPTSAELDVAAKIARSALTWPTGFTETVLESITKARVKHTYTYEHYANDWNIAERPIVPIPETFNITDPVDFEIQGLYHKIRYVQASEVTVEASFPVGGVLPTMTLNESPLKPGPLTQSLYEQLDAILSAQNPDGSWTDRYADSRIATCLMLIYPKVSSDYKAKIVNAVSACLNHYFASLAYNADYDMHVILVNGELDPTDWAATMGWLFYAVALYTHYVDGSYASSRLSEINEMGDALEKLTDWEGWSYARDAAPPHSMSETTIEAAMAWLMYARVLYQAGQLPSNHKARIRLAESYQFIKKLAFNYAPHWSDPKLIDYIRVMDVWDHIYEGVNAWNWAAAIWGMWTPALVNGDYPPVGHVGNIKVHAEEHGWNNPQSEYFDPGYLNVFNTLLALKNYPEIYDNLMVAYATREQLTDLSWKAYYCLHVAALNELS